ncbi:erbin-like [Aplysia californica]|uniref:Erbin-like n=1 Tax=Aplysia californica TaxID=6500 RepID=A0ABM1VR68_APLCA|nr:erbin-like [Aplysia californica]
MFASGINAWTYSTLYSNQLHLPETDNILPDGQGEFNRQELELLMKDLLHIYTAQCHLFAEQYGGVMFQTTPENGTAAVTSAIQHGDKHVLRLGKKIETKSTVLLKKTFRNNVFCKAHQWCLSSTNVAVEERFTYQKEFFSPYEESIKVLFNELPQLPDVPKDFFQQLPNLQYLRLQHCEMLSVLPAGISDCTNLRMVSFKDSGIQNLPPDLFRMPALQRLHCRRLPVRSLPTNVMEFSPLTELVLSGLLLTALPAQLSQLANLQLLDLNFNPLQTLPMELAKLSKLKTLLLSGIPWVVNAGSKVEIPLEQFEEFLKENPPLKYYIGREVSRTLLEPSRIREKNLGSPMCKLCTLTLCGHLAQ